MKCDVVYLHLSSAYTNNQVSSRLRWSCDQCCFYCSECVLCSRTWKYPFWMCYNFSVNVTFAGDLRIQPWAALHVDGRDEHYCWLTEVSFLVSKSRLFSTPKGFVTCTHSDCCGSERPQGTEWLQQCLNFSLRHISVTLFWQVGLNLLIQKANKLSPATRMIIQRLVPFPAVGRFWKDPFVRVLWGVMMCSRHVSCLIHESHFLFLRLMSEATIQY